MLEFISANIGTIAVALVTAAIIAAAAITLIRDKRAGKSHCECSCGGCPNSELCHGKCTCHSEKE